MHASRNGLNAKERCLLAKGLALQGEQQRAAIRDALRQRLVGKEAPPTLDELSALLGLSKTTLRHHIRWLEQRGVVAIQEEPRSLLRKVVVLLEAQP